MTGVQADKPVTDQRDIIAHKDRLWHAENRQYTYDIVSLGAPLDHFGGHVFDGAAKRVGPLLSLVSGQFLGQTKIGEHDMSVLVHQDVFQLDISVDDTQLEQKENYYYTIYLELTISSQGFGGNLPDPD